MTKKTPTFHPRDLDRRPVFFFREKTIALHTAHSRVTHGTRHAARPNLDNNVAQTCPCTGNPEVTASRAVFNEIRMTKKHQRWKKQRYKTTPHRENPGKIVLSTPAELKTFERTPRAKDTPHESRPNLDECVRMAFPYRPPWRSCERCAYQEIRAKADEKITKNTYTKV